ncbi:MAG: Mu transposase domain-containing protein [Candidatus Xenobia bacterium]
MLDYEVARRLHTLAGWSVEKLSKKFRYSERAIRRILESPELDLPREREPLALQDLKERIRQILMEDLRAGRKQPLTRRIYEVLAQEAPSIRMGKASVRQMIDEVRAEIKGQKRVPTPPGKAAQVAWGRLEAVIAGTRLTAQLFIMTLGYSRRTFVMAFPAQNQEAFLEGHVGAFEYFGGVPHSVAYAELRASAKRSLPMAALQEGGSFKALRLHYGFELRHTPPTRQKVSAGERRRLAVWRRNPLWNVPEAESWQQLNAMLAERCRQQDDLPHPEFGGRTVEDLFAEEKAALNAPPSTSFPCCKTAEVTVDNQSRVRYNRVLYSVPSETGRRRLEVRAFYSHLEFWDETRMVARWERSYKPWDERYDYRHYLKFLRRTPCAALNSKFFAGLPDPLQRYRTELLDRYERREAGHTLARVLLLIPRYGEAVILKAVESALALGAVDMNHIMAALPRAIPAAKVA